MNAKRVEDLAQLEQCGELHYCDSCGTKIEAEHGECLDCVQIGPPCERCGQRGTVDRHEVCRSDDCESDRLDAAMDRMKDEGLLR